MLSELASKEEAYRAGGGRFLALRADGDSAVPSRDEDSPKRSIRRPPTACSWRRRGPPTRVDDRGAVAAGVAHDRRAATQRAFVLHVPGQRRRTRAPGPVAALRFAR